MKTTDDIEDFLAQKSIAIAGVSRQSSSAANLIYRAMKDRGYRVFAVNPAATEVEGDPCYRNLAALPEPVDGVVIATPSDVSASVVRDAAALGIPRAGLHRSMMGGGSFAEDAIAAGEDTGVTVIAGGCPLMFMKPVDPGHGCMRWLGQATGRVPTQ